MLHRTGCQFLIAVLSQIMIESSLMSKSPVVAEEWVGHEFMAKPAATFLLDGITVPHTNIDAPFTVSKVEGNRLWVGEAWINKDEVVPVADAATFYTEYLRKHPSDAWGYMNRGLAWAAVGNCDNAITDYTKAIRLDSKYAIAYYNRGNCWADKGEFDKAIKDYTKVIQLDPKDAVAFNNRGVTWAGAGELDKAIQDYSKAIWLDSQFAYAYSNRGSIWNIKREYAKAVNDYAEGIRLDSQDVSACNEFAWLLATCPETVFRDGLDAVILGENLCELSEWKEAGYINTLAAAYAEFGDFDQAVKYQKRCIEQLYKDVDKDEYTERLKLYGEGKPYHEARGDGKRE
tara:strand:+ start:79165 stop:80199 length:1035 start_codon:yes stop_codon:yes gene_type:complete